MTLRFVIALLRFTLGLMLWIVVATIFGRGRMSRRVWRGLRLFRADRRLVTDPAGSGNPDPPSARIMLS